MKENIAVFASSSGKAPQNYYNVAFQLGEVLAQNNYTVSYGAGLGLMEGVANGVIKNNGRIIGVSTKFFVMDYPSSVEARLSVDNTQKQLIVAEDIEHRKDLLMKDADVVVALPGGVGTFEELYGALACGKKVILLNYEGYYDNLLVQHSAFSFIEAKTAQDVIECLEVLKRDSWNSVDFTPSEELIIYVKKICKIVNDSPLSFVAVHDETYSFISVMTKGQYEQLNFSKNEQPNAMQLFLSATHLFLLEHDHPLTYGILHKMLTYNQLGLHEKNNHKNIFLLTINDSSFFEPTHRQLARAINDKLLTEDHISGLINVKLESNPLLQRIQILQHIQREHLVIQQTLWWKKEDNSATESNQFVVQP